MGMAKMVTRPIRIMLYTEIVKANQWAEHNVPADPEIFYQ